MNGSSSHMILRGILNAPSMHVVKKLKFVRPYVYGLQLEYGPSALAKQFNI